MVSAARVRWTARVVRRVMAAVASVVVPVATAAAADPPAGLGAEIDRVAAALGPRARVAVWFGTADGRPLLARDADAPMPSASAIKAAYLLELFAARAPGLADPLPGADAVLADATHPAVVHFTAEQRETAQRLLGGRSTRGIAEAMIGGRDVDNVTYNIAANLVTAWGGGPAGLTRRMRARDPRLGGLVARRYMLADRKADGDNEATAAALAAVHAMLARRAVPGVDPAAIDACREVLAAGADSAGRRVFRKDGELDSDPVTRTRAGWREDAHGARVFAVLVAEDVAAEADRPVAAARLDAAARRIEGLLFDER